MRHELEAALLQNRDDVKRWAVFADGLEAEGDPRGALASLMLRREVTPSRALSEALVAHASLLVALTPESLKTLETRGFPRLAPVFRRGFLFSAGAEQASDFEALVQHPSAALLERVILEVAQTQTLSDWLGTVQSPLPWRSLELRVRQGDEPLETGPWLARLPYLEELTVMTESGDIAFGPSARLRRVRIHGARPGTLASLLRADLPALTALELLASAHQQWLLDPLAHALESRWSRFSEVLLEGVANEETRRLCARSDRPRQVVVRAAEGSEPSFTTALQPELETSFVVLQGELLPAREQTVTQFALLGGVSRLVVWTGSSHGLTLLRLHGTGDAPLVARVALHQLVKKDRLLNGVALTFSASNNAASAWSFGPHVARLDDGAASRNVLPLSRRDDAYHSRAALTREVLDALLGFDPGVDVLEALLLALDASAPRALVGPPLAPGERLPLFTDHEAQPEEPERDEYDDEESEDALDARDEDDDPHSDDYDDGDHWGGAPENVPDFGLPTFTVAASALEEEDDPEDDLDPPLYDAFTADEAEVWTEGPVDLPEHHAAQPGDPLSPEPDEAPAQGSLDPRHTTCLRCAQPGELARCESCQEELCRACAGPQAQAAWEDERPFSCAQCVPFAEGKYVAPVRKR